MPLSISWAGWHANILLQFASEAYYAYMAELMMRRCWDALMPWQILLEDIDDIYCTATYFAFRACERCAAHITRKGTLTHRLLNCQRRCRAYIYRHLKRCFAYILILEHWFSYYGGDTTMGAILLPKCASICSIAETIEFKVVRRWVPKTFRFISDYWV